MKERLVGAAVLILAAILIIPALLDGPDTPDSDTVSRSLELPATDRSPDRTHVIDLNPNSIEEVVAADDVVAVGERAAIIDTENIQTTTPVQAPTPKPTPAVKQEAPAVVKVPLPPVEKPVAGASGWAVQVGSFSSESNARRLAGLLQSSQYPAFVTRHVVQGRVMYRVRVGPEPSRERASELAVRLQEDRQKTQIVPHP